MADDAYVMLLLHRGFHVHLVEIPIHHLDLIKLIHRLHRRWHPLNRVVLYFFVLRSVEHFVMRLSLTLHRVQLVDNEFLLDINVPRLQSQERVVQDYQNVAQTDWHQSLQR